MAVKIPAGLRGNIYQTGKSSYRLQLSLGRKADGDYANKRETIRGTEQDAIDLLIRRFALKYEMGHSTMAMTSRYVKLAQMDIENQHRVASPVIKLVKRGIRPKNRGSTRKS